jgi:DNA polymerase-3 subunit delta
MKIYHNQLTKTLTQGFQPIWLVFGDEPWQKDNSLAAIKSHAQQQGFSEVIRFSSESGFDWQQLMDEYQSMSLFSSQRIIEVEFSTNKIGDAGNKSLVTLAERLTEDIKQSHYAQDVIFIFHGNKLDGASSNRKWFKLFSQLGCYLPLYDVELKAMPQWLNQQSRALKLNLAPELTSLLIELFEGNLLALSQELQKLSLLFNNELVSLEQAEQLVIKQAKFNPFQVVDSLLMGDCAKCISMLDQLQQEGTAPAKIIWALHKEITQLYTMLNKLKEGEQLTQIYKEFRIWDKRKPLYQHALTHIKLEHVKHAMMRISDIDLLSKTSSEFNVFILLADLCITLYHGDRTKGLSLKYG